MNEYRKETEEMLCKGCETQQKTIDFLRKDLLRTQEMLRENKRLLELSPMALFFGLCGCISFIAVACVALWWIKPLMIFFSCFSFVSFVIHMLLGWRNGNY